MKKMFFFLLSFFICIVVFAQKDADFPVKVKNPKMDELINKLWNDLPKDCSVPTYAVVDKGEETCAGLALKHFKAIINNCKMTDAFAEAIKAEFKLLKLIPAGKVAGTILDIADLSSKALSAKSPEDLEADLVKYGFGKVVGDEVVKKLKKITGTPDDDMAADVLTNVTKLFYKQAWDEAKKALLPKPQKYECHPKTLDCEDNVFVSIEPYEGDDPKVIAKVVFSADGGCHCKLACVPDGPAPHLNEWSVHGEMLLAVDKAEVITEGLISKTKALQLTLKAGSPTYHIQASCDDCPHSSNPYKKGGNSFYVGLGINSEDAIPHFATYGLTAAYVHAMNAMWGATAAGGVYFGSQQSVNYMKVQLMAGIAMLNLQLSSVGFSPHLLIGPSYVHSKFKSGTYSYSGGNTNFACALGTDVSKQITDKASVALHADYNPVFAKGGVKNNLEFSLGVKIAVH